jgi:hypothetical protein
VTKYLIEKDVGGNQDYYEVWIILKNVDMQVQVCLFLNKNRVSKRAKEQKEENITDSRYHFIK